MLVRTCSAFVLHPNEEKSFLIVGVSVWVWVLIKGSIPLHPKWSDQSKSRHADMYVGTLESVR